MTLTDDGSILFPSITICKDQMFDNEINNRGLLTMLQSGEVSSANARFYFKNRTFARTRLVKLLSIQTVEGSHNSPCNTVGGPRAGEPCSFPFIYPDCKLMVKAHRCKSNPGLAPVWYRQSGALSLVQIL